MKKNTVFNILLDLKRKFIETLTPGDIKNHDGKCFTRIRKLTMARLLVLILRCSPYSLQIRLDDFYKEIGHKEEVVSKQAFSKARTKLDPDILKASFELTARTPPQINWKSYAQNILPNLRMFSRHSACHRAKTLNCTKASSGYVLLMVLMLRLITRQSFWRISADQAETVTVQWLWLRFVMTRSTM